MPLNAQIVLSILAHESSAGDISRTLRATPASYSAMLADGTGANQANLVWSTTLEIDPSADSFPGDAGFVFTDDRGTVTFSAVKVIYIKNSGPGSIKWLAEDWANGPQDPAGSGITIRPGGAIVYCAPDAAGWPTTGGYFGLAEMSGTRTFADIVIIGEGTVS